MFANAPDSLCIDERGGIKMNWLHNYTHMSFLEIQEGSASCSLVDVLELPTLHIQIYTSIMDWLGSRMMSYDDPLFKETNTL